MIEIIWTYRVRKKRVDDFLRYYRADGIWGKFFSAAPEYRGTDLLRERDAPFLFATVDKWDSYEAYERFLQDHRAEYRRIDEACAEFTLSETKIGCFEAAKPTEF